MSIDGKIFDPTDPTGTMFIGVLGLMAELQADPIRSRTRDAVAAAAAVVDKMQDKTL
jgi:DNA invertase Pin-like site-specific DNA recombinase